MDYYNAMLSEDAKPVISQTLDEAGKIQTHSGSGEVKLDRVRLLDQNELPVEVVKVGQLISIELATTCRTAVDSLVAGFMIKDRLGQIVFGTNTFHHGKQLHQLCVGQSHRFCFSLSLNMGPGTYSVSVALHADDQHISKNYLWQDRVFLFTVVNGDEPVFVGSHQLPTQVSIQTNMTNPV